MKRFVLSLAALAALLVSASTASTASAQWLSADAEKHNQDLLAWSGVDLGKPVRFYSCAPAFQSVANDSRMQPTYLLSSADYPLMANAVNVNLLKLWRRPGGLSNTDRTHWRNYTAVYLPGTLTVWSGKVKMPNAGDLPTYRWTYPTGTIFVDMLTRVRNGEEYPFEVRTREKQASGEWESTAYRPYATEADLPAGSEKQTWVMKSQPGEKLSLIDVDRLDAQAWSVPADTHHADWPAFKPSRIIATSANNDGVFPPGYAGNMVACAKCHQHAGKSSEYASTFRGDDGVLSFHPFEPSSISDNGFRRQVSFVAELVGKDSGLPTGPVAAPNTGGMQSFKTVIGGRR